MTEPRLDPRAIRSRQRLLESALALVRDVGAAGCTIEAVSAHSGVAKTTIYRHFADREDLVFAVLESLKPSGEVPHTDDLVADVTTTLLDLAAMLRSSESAPLVASMLDLAERSERAQELATRFGVRRRALLLARLQQAVGEGVLVGDVDVEMLISQLVGPLFYRRYFGRQEISKRFVTRLAVATLRPLLAAPASGGDGGGGSPR